MTITSFATCLTVKDVKASSAFLTKHFGFTEQMAAEGFVSLVHEQTGINIVYHATGLEVLPEELKHQEAQGVILAFITTNIEAEEIRLKKEGVTITMPLHTESWGEKLFLIEDPNGVVIEIAQWDGQVATADPDGNALGQK